VADLPIPPGNSRKDQKHGEVVYRGPTAWSLMRAFDPTEPAGYEAAKASA
jgi:hypothetical protein